MSSTPVFHDDSEQNRDLTQPCATFPFLQLPKELRLQIYTYLSTHIHKPIDCVFPKRFGYWPVNIYPPSLLISRSIYDEAMDFVNDLQPAAVLCRPNQQQKYCALQAALQRGCEIDRAWLKTNACGGQNPRISPAAVDAALQILLEKVPYSQRRNPTILHQSYRDLRHFFAQTIIRLRRDSQIHLTLWVETRPYKRFWNWYGSERSARAVAWYTADSGGVWLLRCNLLSAIASGQTGVTTKVTVRGEKGDKAYEWIKQLFEVGAYRSSEDVECVPLEKDVYKKLLEGPFVGEGT
ncbi:hypothetical protein BDV96DRAFT_263299 [Lophiotrema nucula]|uniref:F-box domain-containing protein n=1 Tax=Lophiotrema nucula TaxID=690887 RepID=A0A6A5YM18_9PLEO|nr:hypothetical protein BDV96DRAFT_263299 [Lophiotrema nucula]